MRDYSNVKLTLTALTVAATMFASSASAFDPDDLQKLKDTANCIGCDLKEAILSSDNLNGATLMNASLIGASLMGAGLRDANLDLAYMNGAILCNTTMPDGSVIYSGC